MIIFFSSPVLGFFKIALVKISSLPSVAGDKTGLIKIADCFIAFC